MDRLWYPKRPGDAHICVRWLSQHWFKQWHVAGAVLGHYLSQWWLIFNLILSTKIQNVVSKIGDGFVSMHPSYYYGWIRVNASIVKWFNTLRPGQNWYDFEDDIFKCIFLKDNVWIPIEISRKFVPKRPINNIQALVQIMAWRRPDDKPLSEPMIVSFPTHIHSPKKV